MVEPMESRMCGIMGEQGAESLHASFNNMELAYNNMRDRVERIKVILQNHLLQIQPNVSSLETPPKKKRSKKKLEATNDIEQEPIDHDSSDS